MRSPIADQLAQCSAALDPSKLVRAYLRPVLVRAATTTPFRAFHGLPHTALTDEAVAGDPLVYVQMKAGHSQGQITERYIHAAQVPFSGAAATGEAWMFAFTERASTASTVGCAPKRLDTSSKSSFSWGVRGARASED